MLGSHEEAEDALQRVFVAAHRHLSDGTEHVTSSLAVHDRRATACLSMLRARRETLALDDVREPSADVLALAEEVELGEDLKDLLGTSPALPDDQRARSCSPSWATCRSRRSRRSWTSGPTR
jgi:DNA-directed RNA polymerase specialized sigma24 family protein